jgi:hypothetical protein
VATAKRAVIGPCDSGAAPKYPDDAKSVHDGKPDFQRLLQEVSTAATVEEAHAILDAVDLSALTEAQNEALQDAAADK